jgi:hypothetical protein
MKIITVALCALLLSSCDDTEAEVIDATEVFTEPKPDVKPELLVGDWVEPNPIDADELQGIELLKDGKARSINMETTQYSKWYITEGKLALIAKSIGIHTSSIDTTVYTIERLTDKELVLKDRDLTISYTKQ